MKRIPINTTDEGCAFTIRTGYERHAYLNGMTRGGASTLLLECWRYMKLKPINTTPGGLAYGVKASYFKNASLVTLTRGGHHFPCTGVLEIHERTDNSESAEELRGGALV